MKMRRFFWLAIVLTLSMASLAAAATDKAASEKSSDKTDKSKTKLQLASFMLDEAYPEGPGQPGIFGELSPNLSKVIERIDKAAADDKLYGIVIHLDDASLGLGKINELRAAIARRARPARKCTPICTKPDHPATCWRAPAMKSSCRR